VSAEPGRLEIGAGMRYRELAESADVGRALEERLRGQAADGDAIERATAGELEDVDPPSDSHASGEYRLEMARVMARRAIEQALGTKGRA
jgi:carbon-monoxide dehydrogenase medium subunit